MTDNHSSFSIIYLEDKHIESIYTQVTFLLFLLIGMYLQFKSAEKAEEKEKKIKEPTEHNSYSLPSEWIL